ncbi:hypothetical protein [Alteromonas sp. A079]|uniref:hypothetical protein n=1 Tax=Alteromonas sp. A079 TaxID=3410268 RepID=UPI003BA39404
MKFSQLYCEKGDVRSDSERMRVRLLSKFEALPIEQYQLVKIIELECGIEIENDYNGYYYLPDFFSECELRDFLDTLTFIFSLLHNRPRYEESWVDFTNKVFREEHVKYQMDSKGVVHLFIDEAFEATRAGAIEHLDKVQLRVAKEHYERTFLYLDEEPINTRGSVRSVFDAVESAAKEITNGSQLNKNLITDRLSPLILAPIQCSNEKLVTEKLIKSFIEWVNACHFYRHAQAEPKAAPPSLETTILIITQGSGFLRLLCTLINSDVK